MNEFETAVWWAKARSAGPLRVTSGHAAPAGMRRLVEPEAVAVWLLPWLPDDARPTVLDELGLPGPAVDNRNDTARALAVCLRGCWTDTSAPIWPGSSCYWPVLLRMFADLVAGRDLDMAHRAFQPAVRRLAGSGWLRWREGGTLVSLGPRVAQWHESELSTLRELWRMMPAPQAVSDATGAAS